jgi:hypothetical protein
MASLFRAGRPIFAQAARPQFTQAFIRNTTRNAGRRFQSTASDAQQASQQTQSWFRRMMDSPVGLKTVHFWYEASCFEKL